MNWADALGIEKSATHSLRAMGYLYVRQGAYDIALKIFHALLVLEETENAYDLQTLGAIYLQKGEALSSLEYLDRSLTIEPEHPFTQLNRAKALLALGYKRQSLEQLSALLHSKNPEAVAQAAALLEGIAPSPASLQKQPQGLPL